MTYDYFLSHIRQHDCQYLHCVDGVACEFPSPANQHYEVEPILPGSQRQLLPEIVDAESIHEVYQEVQRSS